MKRIILAILFLSIGFSINKYSFGEDNSWSQMENGVKAAISMKIARVINESSIISVHLTLSNESNIATPLKIDWDKAKLTFQVVDEQDIEIPRTTAEYDGFDVATGDLILPCDSQLTFNISKSGVGIPVKGKYTIIEFGTENIWILDKAKKNKYFLQITIQVEDIRLKKNDRYWHGTIKIPKVKIPGTE